MARTKRKINPIQPAPAPELPNQRVYQTGGYIRLSVEDSGRTDIDTIETQKTLVREFIEAQPDLQLCSLFCDNGRTGTNFDRPAFEALMDAVRSGKIDCIVVKDLSRFGRNYLETGNYLERIFPYLGVRFIAINDNFDTLTAERSSDGYIVPLKNIMNAVYSKDISRKICSALSVKQKNGEFIGSWAPYGYKKCADDYHRLEPDAETAPVVRQIFQMRCAGAGYQMIVRSLIREGIPSPSQYHYLKGDTKAERCATAKWHVPMVQKILQNEMYLGHMVQGRRRSVFGETRGERVVPADEWIVVRNTHEALIDEQTFQTVQQMAEQCRTAHKKCVGQYEHLGTIPNLFLGLLFCADCKRPMMRRKETFRGTRLHYTYVCRSHIEDPDSCPTGGFRETDLKAVVWTAIQHEIALTEDLAALAQQYDNSSDAASRKQAEDREITAAIRAQQRASMLYDSLYQNYVDKLMTEQEYTEMKRKYRADMERAKARLAELEQRKQDRRSQTTQNIWLATYSRFRDETELTEEMTHALLERVEIGAGRQISVTLRYQDEYRALVEFLNAEGQVRPE